MPRSSLVLILVSIAPAVGRGQGLNATPVDYGRDIKPIFSSRCFACHGAVRQRAGLRLDALSLIHKGSKSNPVIAPGKAAQSLLINAVVGKDRPRMPPEGAALTQHEIDTLRTWIDEGAKGPNEPIPADPRNHWAFRPPVKPVLPEKGNAIDGLVAAAWKKHGLHPNPPADKAVLLRRVYLDLIGLPPTREQLHAFLEDHAPDAYEKVVDLLLASPQYGERWGRHWMDVWRYSDPFGNGQEYRYSQRHIWRWRDWIIESLNADKGYDRMIMEMLAGDEIAPTDRDTLRATGYLARNWYKFNRNAWMQDTVEYTAAGFLGVTLRCARCHDHKYDPVSQKDYYHFRAFFEPHDIRIDAMPGQTDLVKDGVARAFDAHPEAATYLFRRGDERAPDKERSLSPAVPVVLGGEAAVSPVRFTQKEINPPTSSGRRLALARWITDRNNPLTARVAVNHMWMRHFGKPLVASVANFGLSGQKPTHPELLDYLAVELIQSGWSMKKLHREMVTSSIYRLDSGTLDTRNLAADPENRYLWHMNSRRMEGEAVRDSVLATSGQLDRTMGGPVLDDSQGQTSCRRTIYFRFNTEYRLQFLDQFDAASTTECYQRPESVIPQQALALSNSALALNQSRRLARQLTQAASEPGAFVIAAFEQVLGRACTAAEQARCEQFLRDQAEVLKHPAQLHAFPIGPDPPTLPSTNPAQRARENLVLVLYNHNDFVTIR
jgi:Protein of unknown function (DUF1553)/Protein of unknown function (DUF1549)/Planctomycete cytochrome C